MKFCIDCKKQLTSHGKNTKRCWVCAHLYQKGINHPNYKDGKTMKKYKCIVCSKRICTVNGVYGSKLCKSCATKKLFKNPENHPQWLGGISKFPYPFNFNDELKEFIRNRDNFTCQNCGISEEEHIINNGQVLHVHHIDYNKENIQKENLLTLCLKCNVNANKNRPYWKKFYTDRDKEITKCLK